MYTNILTFLSSPTAGAMKYRILKCRSLKMSRETMKRSELGVRANFFAPPCLQLDAILLALCAL